MKTDPQSPKVWPTLADIERAVLVECREWGRQRLEQRLPRLADQTGEVFPLRQRQQRPLTLRIELGLVQRIIDYGQDPHTQKWFCPQQRAWGLLPHQKITPGLAEKLCFTAAATTSYEPAAAVAGRWGVAVDDSPIHQQVQFAGARAEQQAQARISTSAAPASAPKTAGPPGALVILMDGWMLRPRGGDWGRKPAHVAGERVAWQECKSAVIYRLAQAAQTENGRGLLVEKFIVADVGEPREFGWRVQAEARRRGLGKAPRV